MKTLQEPARSGTSGVHQGIGAVRTLQLSAKLVHQPRAIEAMFVLLCTDVRPVLPHHRRPLLIQRPCKTFCHVPPFLRGDEGRTRGRPLLIQRPCKTFCHVPLFLRGDEGRTRG
ncbi:uncharacterized protein LOC121836424 [Ixodes scapularis]|uniref:uncharacterized protein LOC121836424 n=1 Tax=Ixodes scapularis TaxID=6945 RepID=UPI001C388669|nr:uncharacterized protein LOC121836424 [Ixodes scapularis]